MSRIISISVPTDAEFLIDDLKSLGGSVSGHVIEAIRLYLKDKGTGEDTAPFWYVQGKDYSHLPQEVRDGLRKWGYTGP